MRRHVIISVIVMSLLMTAAIASAKERVFYYHNDHLGTPRVMTNSTGTKVWEAEYLPFGEAAVNEDPDGDGALVVSNIRFPGQYYDSETGLHYNYHRDYQPRTGRYQEADPMGIQKGENHLYVYAQNNPVNIKDRFGLTSEISIPPALIDGIMKEFLGMIVNWSVGEVTGAYCATKYCKRSLVPKDYLEAYSTCMHIFYVYNLPATIPTIPTSDAFLDACAIGCRKMTRTSIFKKTCLCDDKNQD